jgi:hypothetical protein
LGEVDIEQARARPTEFGASSRETKVLAALMPEQRAICDCTDGLAIMPGIHGGLSAGNLLIAGYLC